MMLKILSKNIFFLLFFMLLLSNTFSATTTDTIKTTFYEGTKNHIHYFKLSLNQPLDVDASVTYTTQDGTAQAGSDYIATSGTAVIPAGEISILIPVEIIGDTVTEKDETFSLIINNPIGGIFSQNQTNITVTHTILDDDMEINVLERFNDHVHYFLLEIDEPLATEASVNYQTLDGTAIKGEDYEATSGIAIIPAGETKTRIAVKIFGDSKIESDETFSLVISNPIGAKFPEGKTEIISTHTILNDDFPTPSTPVDNTQRIAKDLSRIMLSGITPILETQTLLEQPATLANAFALNISNKILDCPSSGTFEFTFTDDASGDLKYSKVGDNLAITASQCNNGTATSNGDYHLKITGVAGDTLESEVTLTNLLITDNTTNTTFTGLLTTSETTPTNNDDTVLIINSNNLQLTSNSSNYAFSNINAQIATEIATSERKLQNYSTTVTLSNSSNNGDYITTIVNTLKIAPTDKYPYTGQLQIQRQDATMNITITVINTNTVKIETDTSGDHIADYVQDIPWAELSSGF